MKDQNHKVSGHKSKGEEGSKDNKREKYFSSQRKNKKDRGAKPKQRKKCLLLQGMDHTIQPYKPAMLRWKSEVSAGADAF